MTDTTPDKAQLDAPKKLSVFTKVSFGIGAGAFGVKNNGFDYFLLFFYGTVLGVDGRLVGLALLIALVFDALSDPIVGYISDNWRSKWGRRHPFMYASAIPIALTYFLLWAPPEGSDMFLFIYLTVLAILIRTLITLYETPSSALNPDLTPDYDERTTLSSYRLFFGWTIGNFMTVFAFGVLFAATEAYPDGRQNPGAYATYGLIGSAMIFTFIMIPALGTHSRIPYLQKAPPKRNITIGKLFTEIFETLANKSFTALFVAYLFGAIATGVAAALSFLLLTYFWEFTTEQTTIWVALVFLSAAIGFVLAPIMVRRFGKKLSVIILGAFAFTIAPLPILLRLLGVLPENGDPILFPLLATINTIDIGLIVALQAILASMVADLVEESELKTGRRSEGVFFAATTFIRKSTQGFGVLAAGFVLAYAALPDEPVVGQVPEDALFRLGIAYVPLLFSLYMALLVAISFYKIDRDSHTRNLAELAARKAGGTFE